MIEKLASIIVVGHNNWPDIELTVESAIRQSYQPIEVIVVDNGSTDATQDEIKRRFAGSVQYIRQENRDCAGGYNAGFESCRGEFIQFVDGDDILMPNKIAKQIAVFESDPTTDVVYSDIRAFQSRPGTKNNWTDFDQTEHKDILHALIRQDDVVLVPPCMLFRRKVIDAVGPWDETIYVEDRDYLIRTAWAGFRFRYLPGVVYFYRIGPGQKSSRIAVQMKGLEAVYDKAQGYITTEPYAAATRNMLATIRLNMVLLGLGMTRQERYRKLAEARSTSPNQITLGKMALAGIAISIPGGRHIAEIAARCLTHLKSKKSTLSNQNR